MRLVLAALLLSAVCPTLALAQDADAGTPPPAADDDAGTDATSSDAPSPGVNPAPAPPQPPPPDAPQFVQAATLDHPPTDELVWNISAGATLNTGNTQSFAGNAGTHFSIRRGPHAFLFDFQAIEGLSHVFRSASDTWVENSSSITDTARYDYFFSANDAIFLATSNRHDRFAGLEFRFQAQLGYLRNLFVEEKHKLWAEVGYDFTFDKFYYDPAMLPPPPAPTDRVIHSARVYLGYDNHLNDYLTFTTGLEVLFRPYAVADQGDFQLRLASISELHVKIDTHFALGLTFTARYDSQPAIGKTNLDTITVLSLLYTLI